jgi:hypothetical protein
MKNTQDNFVTVFYLVAAVTMILSVAYVYSILVTSKVELDEKVEATILELHDHPLTLPIAPITDEEFKLFQEINGLSNEKELDIPEKGGILSLEDEGQTLN